MAVPGVGVGAVPETPPGGRGVDGALPMDVVAVVVVVAAAATVAGLSHSCVRCVSHCFMRVWGGTGGGKRKGRGTRGGG